jgi:hypothetical protein
MQPFIRILLFCILVLKENGVFEYNVGNISSYVSVVVSAIRPWQVPFCMMALFFIIHFPSLNMSSPCDKKSSFALAEHIVCHTILQSLILSLAEVNVMIFGCNDAGTYVWNTAAYLSLYFAWRVYAASHIVKRCTLSPFILSAAMMLCVPLVVVAMPNKATFAACTHLFGWLVADISASLHPLPKPKLENV